MQKLKKKGKKRNKKEAKSQDNFSSDLYYLQRGSNIYSTEFLNKIIEGDGKLGTF